MNRRKFLLGMAGLIAAPAVVRAESLMKIMVPKMIIVPPAIVPRGQLLDCTFYNQSYDDGYRNSSSIRGLNSSIYQIDELGLFDPELAQLCERRMNGLTPFQQHSIEAIEALYERAKTDKTIRITPPTPMWLRQAPKHW